MDKELTDFLKQHNLDMQFNELENLLKKNEFTFDFQNEKYRVVKPTFGQKKETYIKRNNILIKLIQDKTYLFERELRKLLKESRGIDIDSMDNQIMLLQRQKEDKQLELGKALEAKADEKTLELYRNEIAKIENRQQVINFEKSKWLETSLETQLDTEVYLHLTFILTQKLIDVSGQEPKWVNVWNTYDEFLNSYEELIDIACYYATIISQNELKR